MACHLELMGLRDAGAYRRLARDVLAAAVGGPRPLLGALNIPNKKPGEQLLEWAAVLRAELPQVPLCVHYSLKHQRGGGDPTDSFLDFCSRADALGISRVLLVTGPRGPRPDALDVLERLLAAGRRRGGARPATRLGVAFNACLPTIAARQVERQRLTRKLKTGLVGDVWLNCGSDLQLLEEGIEFVRTAARDLHLTNDLALFGSVLRPNEPQLQQMRERPWNGVHFGDDYLGSVAGMEKSTRAVLALFGKHGVVPIVESKVRSPAEMEELRSLLRSLADAQGGEEARRGRRSGESSPSSSQCAKDPEDSTSTTDSQAVAPWRRVDVSGADEVAATTRSSFSSAAEEVQAEAAADSGRPPNQRWGRAAAAQQQQQLQPTPRSFYAKARPQRRWQAKAREGL